MVIIWNVFTGKLRKKGIACTAYGVLIINIISLYIAWVCVLMRKIYNVNIHFICQSLQDFKIKLSI